MRIALTNYKDIHVSAKKDFMVMVLKIVLPSVNA